MGRARRVFTEEEDAYIIAQYTDGNREKCVKELRSSPVAVRRRAEELNVLKRITGADKHVFTMRKFDVPISVPERGHPIIRTIFYLMNREQIGFADLAQRAGIHANTIKNWQVATTPNLALADAVLGVFGYKLVLAPLDTQSTLMNKAAQYVADNKRGIDVSFDAVERIERSRSGA